MIGLAKPPQEIVKKLPPTDSRHRTDYFLMEQGRWEEVSPDSDLFCLAQLLRLTLPIIRVSCVEPQAGVSTRLALQSNSFLKTLASNWEEVQLLSTRSTKICKEVCHGACCGAVCQPCMPMADALQAVLKA